MFGFIGGIYKFNTSRVTTFQTLKDTTTTFSTTFSTSRSTTTTFNTTKTRNTIYANWTTSKITLTNLSRTTVYSTSYNTTDYPSYSRRYNAVELNLDTYVYRFYYYGYRGQGYSSSLTVSGTTYFSSGYVEMYYPYRGNLIVMRRSTSRNTSRSTVYSQRNTITSYNTTNKTISTSYTGSTSISTTTTFNTSRDTSSTFQTLQDTSKVTTFETDFYE